MPLAGRLEKRNCISWITEPAEVSPHVRIPGEEKPMLHTMKPLSEPSPKPGTQHD